MPGLFSKVFKKEATPKKDKVGAAPVPVKPRWTDAWQRTQVEPEEVQELLQGCTAEIKSRAIETPFLLLPFRPASDPSAARTFVRNFFGPGTGNDPPMSGEKLATELRLAEPLVLCSVLKWAWSRLPGGVVTWDIYELFKIGERDSDYAHDAFSTFLPLITLNEARAKIIVDFFDLMAAIAAHGKSNGFPGRKLSRYAAWWAFEHKAVQGGFDEGYKSWAKAANATSHLFFAYLRSLAPDPIKGALSLPRSLQQLLEQSEYPPEPNLLLRSDITKVVFVVETVSPTPFALLRRAKNFEYRSDDQVLQAFTEFEDPIRAITDECSRILQGVATANESSNAKLSTSLRDVGWSRFEDIGFGESHNTDVKSGIFTESALTKKRSQRFEGLQSLPASNMDLGRPTTPSWADFMSSGFSEQVSSSAASFMPPDKQLPPLSIRGTTSYSERPVKEEETNLGAGELASITGAQVDDVFWWVWITSLSSEETTTRKATFGRCAFIETKLSGGTWLLFEEIIKGAKAEPANPGYVAEKKSRFGFRRSTRKAFKNTTTNARVKPDAEQNGGTSPAPHNKLAPDQQAKIQAVAAALSQKKATSEASPITPERRGRLDADAQAKTTSVLTLQPVIVNEAAPAMKWASSYDKNEIRSQYLGNKFAGKGSAVDLPSAENKSISGGVPKTPSKASNDKSHANGNDAATNQTPSTMPFTPSKQSKSAEAFSSNTPQGEANPPPRTSSRGKTNSVILSSAPDVSSPTKSTKSTEQASETQGGSPAAPQKIPRKLPGRLGSVFGRKKTDEENSQPQPAVARKISNPNGGTGSAVAAARAALEAKSQQSNAQSVRQQVTTKHTPINDEPTAAANAVEPSIAEPTASMDNLYPERSYAPSYTTDSHIDEAETHAAEHEFSKFDQNLSEDTQAAESSVATTAEPTASTLPEHSVNTEPNVASHDIRTVPEPSTKSNDGTQVSETEAGPKNIDSEVEQRPSASRALSEERLAQIRKNAADQLAARNDEAVQGEGDLQKKHGDEEGDELAGEETIETRVARIKARVAELTSNMEVPSHERSAVP